MCACAHTQCPRSIRCFYLLSISFRLEHPAAAAIDSVVDDGESMKNEKFSTKLINATSSFRTPDEFATFTVMISSYDGAKATAERRTIATANMYSEMDTTGMTANLRNWFYPLHPDHRPGTDHWSVRGTPGGLAAGVRPVRSLSEDRSRTWILRGLRRKSEQRPFFFYS